MRSQRLDKKLHKKWLDYGVIDAVQVSCFRKKLFSSKENEVFHIDDRNHEWLPDDVAKAIEKYKLQYCVSKIPVSEAEAWLSAGGLIIIRFWAKDHPNIFVDTGNNPSVV